MPYVRRIDAGGREAGCARSEPPVPRPPAAVRELGAHGEALACEHMERLGFTVLARNARAGRSEIDIVAFDGRVLAFVEVKTQRVSRRRAGISPLERLDARQRGRLRRAAAQWLRDHPHPYSQTVRLDAIGVRVDGRGDLVALEHLESAW